MDTPRRRSLVEKLLRRKASPTAAIDPETQSTTGLIKTDNSTTSEMTTITLPLTGGGTETLVIPNDARPADPQNADPEGWKFHLKHRNASAAASDTGDRPGFASDVEKAQFLSLMEQTKGMNEEQIKAFLKTRGSVDGGKVMRNFKEGKSGGGYMQVVGGDRGAF